MQTPHSKLFHLTKIHNVFQREATTILSQKRDTDRIRQIHLIEKATLINCIQTMDYYHKIRERGLSLLAGKLIWVNHLERIGANQIRGSTAVHHKLMKVSRRPI